MTLRGAAALLLLICLHLGDLQLPFFWDEAGYFVPAALDLLRAGLLLPRSVEPNAHPPLVMGSLALVWSLAGFSIVATRLTMLAWAAVGCWGAFALGERLGGVRAGWMSASCVALYPVYFAQSTLAQLDMPAAALATWGLVFYGDRRWRAACVLLSLAVMAKESAVAGAVALAALELAGRRWKNAAWLLAPVALLAAWLCLVRWQTGYWMGNAEFGRFNANAASLTPDRLLATAGLRLWHLTAHLHLFVLTVPALWFFRRAPVADSRLWRAAALCAGAYAVAFTLVGGAVLARYLLPAVALVIVLSCAVLAVLPARPWAALAAGVAFGAGLFVLPPYHCAYDDTLLYRTFVRLHRQAAAYLEPLGETVVTTWPATDELSRPELGYVRRPVRVVAMQDVSIASVRAARGQCPACPILVFPTQYEPAESWLRPGRWLRRLGFWRKAQQEFEVRSSIPTPPELAAAVQGRVEWQAWADGLYAAVIR